MSLIPFFVLWVLLAQSVIAKLIRRKSDARNVVDSLNVLDAVSAQRSALVAVAQKLEVIDKWGKILTIVTVAYGVVLAGMYVYQVWVQNTRLGV